PGQVRYRGSAHTIHRVVRLLGFRGLRIPHGMPIDSSVISPKDVFAGYLMLDAWIGNQDRHHENWGVIITPTGEVFLAPTFDHASSLGRNETDANRAKRLATRDVGFGLERYVERAQTPLYESETSPTPLTTLGAFLGAARFSPKASKVWLDRMMAIPDTEIVSIFERIPRTLISDVAIEFAIKMLQLNRARLAKAGVSL
ncbi:MAG TPA: hypothetical protein VF720_16280, partial [Candidatus Eisenbacteria bacterium]